jgi:para-aminobenzoate synthetase/4-amino-4-deoxychorismate lyase
MYTVSNMLLNRLLGHFAQTEQFAFFDTSRPGEADTLSYLFQAPLTRLRCGIDNDPVLFLQEIQKWLDNGFYVAGWFGYEFGALLVGDISGPDNIPDGAERIVADLGVYGEPQRFDHQSGNYDFKLSAAGIDDEYKVSGIQPNIDENEYLQALEAVLDYIRAGDTYQVNYTLKLLFNLEGSAEALYRDLRRNQSVLYGAYIRWADERVMSFSPELFFRKNKQGLVVRPMKGTLKRGRNPEEDAQACAFLHSDQKNRSENVMIVDLLRNDLGRVLHEAGGGEVKVQSLFDVETYESLLQMTSTIDGSPGSGKMDDVSLQTLFRALFPCGSVTGAPKIRTMEIIEELEKERRGVYTGAIGFFTPGGEAVFNVPIRTLILNGDSGEMGIGSGITHDSDPLDEWRECLLKGRFLTSPVPDFFLFETLLWVEGDGYWLLEEHLERLEASAEYYYFAFDRLEAAARLGTYIKGKKGPERVRLILAKDGTLDITSKPCVLPQKTCLPEEPEMLPQDLPVVRFSTSVMDSQQSWCMHKTTRRELYDSEYARACEDKLFDVIFVNEKGEVTEGAITNIFIYQNGRYLTPPVSCGLLAGTMRRTLLAQVGDGVMEKVLLPEDVYNAEAVFLCNSVRGVVQVRVERR